MTGPPNTNGWLKVWRGLRTRSSHSWERILRRAVLRKRPRQQPFPNSTSAVRPIPLPREIFSDGGSFFGSFVIDQSAYAAGDFTNTIVSWDITTYHHYTRNAGPGRALTIGRGGRFRNLRSGSDNISARYRPDFLCRETVLRHGEPEPVRASGTILLPAGNYFRRGTGVWRRNRREQRGLAVALHLGGSAGTGMLRAAGARRGCSIWPALAFAHKDINTHECVFSVTEPRRTRQELAPLRGRPVPSD